MNITEGTVIDPFIPDSDRKLSLWRDPAGRNWLWLDSATNQPVYMQNWRAEWKKHVALYFEKGFTQTGVSSYNFINFKCFF